MASRQQEPVLESAAAVSAKSRTRLTVVTAEGDKVTISLAARAKVAAASQVAPNASSQTVAASVSSQLRITVEGDLNEAELADLGELFRAVNSLSSQAQQAGSPDPAAFLESIEGLESLAGFAYSHRQTVEVGTLLHVVA